MTLLGATKGKKEEVRDFVRTLLSMVAILFLCRVSREGGVLILGSIGLYASLTRRMGLAMSVFLLIPFLMVVNPILLPRGGGFAAFSRILSTLLSLTMFIGAVYGANPNTRKERLPLSGIVIFLLSAFISSVQGIFPLISYFKLINFSLFLLGLYAGTADLESRPVDSYLLRNTLLSLATLFIFGSLMALFFPVVAYYTSSLYYIATEGLEYASEILAEDRGGMGLFSGITVHSQFLGPALACFSCWLCCDLFLGNGEFKWLHLLLIICIPPMIFMTRSRAGLIAYIVSWFVLAFHFFPQIRVGIQRRRRIVVWLFVGIVSLAIIGMVAEMQGQVVSRWLRKTDNLVEDHRALANAVTESRRVLIYRCMSEFSRNPLLGTGFQVVEEHVSAYHSGRLSLFSAPIEKGFLPLMILGETGISGAVFFVAFLFSFFAGCHQKGYVATSSLFLVYLSTNLAESTFFSPSGGGGVMWMICVLGGFVIDMTAKHRHMEATRHFPLPSTHWEVGPPLRIGQRPQLLCHFPDSVPR